MRYKPHMSGGRKDVRLSFSNENDGFASKAIALYKRAINIRRVRECASDVPARCGVAIVNA